MKWTDFQLYYHNNNCNINSEQNECKYLEQSFFNLNDSLFANFSIYSTLQIEKWSYLKGHFGLRRKSITFCNQTFSKPASIDKLESSSAYTIPQPYRIDDPQIEAYSCLSYITSTAQLVGSNAIVVTECPTLLAHHHRFQATRTRRIANFFLQDQLRLHCGTRMINHNVFTTADYCVVMHGTINTYITIDHT